MVRGLGVQDAEGDAAREDNRGGRALAPVPDDAALHRLSAHGDDQEEHGHHGEVRAAGDLSLQSTYTI